MVCCPEIDGSTVEPGLSSTFGPGYKAGTSSPVRAAERRKPPSRGSSRRAEKGFHLDRAGGPNACSTVQASAVWSLTTGVGSLSTRLCEERFEGLIVAFTRS